MNEKQRVAVFDPKSGDLRILPLNKLKGQATLISSDSYVDNPMLASDFEKVEVPKWRRHFDVYTSNDLGNPSGEGQPTYSRNDTEGRSFLARLYYSRLGIASNVQRAVSAKHRTLYIGEMPEY